ncbi:hypothetical protein DVH24_026660 [Malus domestica]|uniref:Uncharacterized protein n=1 Tax=Malus domestica TaxID=3750 RepID=A0A498K1T7_MALDO|nr:hypothetical protein DVH24_026660 [Malus domestica]
MYHLSYEHNEKFLMTRIRYFVSFGSMVKLTQEQLLEFWHGLVNSGRQFLWAVRLDKLRGEQGELVIPVKLERGFIVEWVPQEEVLAHKAVGGEVNSIPEGIWAGVPMLCWPQLADQPVICRY